LLAGREERVTQLGILNDILRAISAILDLDSLYDAIYAGCSRLFDTTNFFIALHNPATGDLIPRLWYGRGERMADREGVPLERGLGPLVVAERLPLLTDDYWAECRRRGVEGSPRLASEAPLSWLGVPMLAGGRTVGAIVVASTGEPYTDEDVTLLSAIASGCAVAIENARAYASARRRADQLRALNEMSRSVVSIREVDRLLPHIAGAVRAIFDYSHVGIVLHAPETDELVVRAQSNRQGGASDLGLRIPVGEHLVGQAAAGRRPVLVNDVARNPRFLRTAALRDTRASLALPIILGDRLLGVLSVESDRADAFDDDDVATLQTLADGVAVAIDNARLFEAEQRRRQELASILDVTTAATSSLLVDEVLGVVARGIADAVDMPSCGVYLLDDSGRWLLPATGVAAADAANGAGTFGRAFYDLPIDLQQERFLREVVTGRQALVCADAEGDPRTDKRLVRALGLKSLLAVPLIAKDKVLGAVIVPAVRDRYDFSPVQSRLVAGIADTAALAVENARLYARSRELATAEERNRLAREIHDTLAQGLTAVTLHLEVADALLDGPVAGAEAREKVRTAMRLTRANLEEARRSVMDLRAAPLQDLSLPEALERLVERAGRAGGFEARFRHRGIAGDDGAVRLPARLEAGFYRIAQELLSNIGKHADATQVDVRLERCNGSLVLTVADDGVGFDPAVARPSGLGGGFGLIGLRERVALLGGSLQLDSAPDEGTRVRVTVPVTPDEG
ncbi:MAG: GAF domain-containing protein, partial [Chloroflexota bacterium]|nr:GAF domain-containing protein [Chloroflexota bacterium]